MRKFWISFRVAIQGGAIEGDLVADSEGLTEEFLKGVKSEVSATICRESGGQILKMGEVVFLAVIELDPPKEPDPLV